MQVRRAEEKDIPAVGELLHQVLEVHAAGRPDLFATGTRKYTDEQLVEIFADDTRPVFVAVGEEGEGPQPGEVWGYAFCVLEEQEPGGSMQPIRTLYVDDICVDENHRRLGVATTLYNYVVEYARSIACHHVTLNVWECNPGARAFYEAMGMKPYKTGMEQLL